MKELNAWEMPLSGTSLIEASAGTRKTYTLTTLYLRLLVEQDLLPSEILVVTYTQAATAELRERVRERIQQAIEAQADPDEDRANGQDGEGEEADEPEKVALRALALASRERAFRSGFAGRS